MIDFFNRVAEVATPIWTIIAPFALPGALYLAYQGIGIMQAKGYQTTYATALVRAAGAGAAAAQAKGLDPFTGAGLKLAANVGGTYLMQQVPVAAAGLGITDLATHATKVEAQLNTIAMQAQADANATVAAGGNSAVELLASLASQVASGSGPAALQAQIAAGSPTQIPPAPAT